MTRPALRVVPDRPARLRVITAGDVGNVSSRLGTSGLDVVAVVDTEAELVVAVGNNDPDAIVVQADLCESLEHVHELAPDAALIVVGDRTPAGALGHIDRGVTGTVLARLIQALAAGGLAAAAPIPGFTPVPTPGRIARLRPSPRQGLVAGAAVTVVTAAIGLAILRGDSPERVPPAALPLAPPSVSAPLPPPDSVLPSTRVPRVPRSTRSAPPAETTRQTVDASSDVASPPSDRPAETPPDQSPPPQGSADPRPPGKATGWENKPPKQDDNGHHEGWTKGNGPKDRGRAVR